MDIHERIERDFTHHAPTPDQIARMAIFRNRCKELALYAADQLKPSREQAMTLTHLEQASMFFNAGMARGEQASVPGP